MDVAFPPLRRCINRHGLVSRGGGNCNHGHKHDSRSGEQHSGKRSQGSGGKATETGCKTNRASGERHRHEKHLLVSQRNERAVSLEQVDHRQPSSSVTRACDSHELPLDCAASPQPGGLCWPGVASQESPSRVPHTQAFVRHAGHRGSRGSDSD